MIARVTAENPTGIATFDHGGIAELPEYALASSALDALDQAIRRSGNRLGRDRWFTVVQELAAAPPYAEPCDECNGHLPTPAPYAAHVADGRLDGRYRCPSCGHVWSREHAVALPEFTD